MLLARIIIWEFSPNDVPQDFYRGELSLEPHNPFGLLRKA